MRVLPTEVAGELMTDLDSTRDRRRSFIKTWILQVGLPVITTTTLVRVGTGPNGMRDIFRLHTVRSMLEGIVIMIPLAYAIGAILWRLGFGDQEPK
jgi:phosphate/sulfate permease